MKSDSHLWSTFTEYIVDLIDLKNEMGENGVDRCKQPLALTLNVKEFPHDRNIFNALK